ncbi:uncharacterized protein LOC114951338 isoform X2 [Acropora millepora]|uniref:uncharacterized protein LOC114951338 isoform X2 n=1 Tax=Acropora millepora TaxID=45264 RepID=UPI001CF4D909|nr:uncharacterized protein LOC114951338 isoform X2 [Acropora millepora]
MFSLHSHDQALATPMKAMAQIQKKFPSVVYRAGTQQGPSFDFEDKIDEDPRLYFPLNQDVSQSARGQKGKTLENVCLWRADTTNLKKYFTLKEKFDGICQVELKDSTNANCALKEEKIQEIQRCLKSFEWRKTTVPRCNGGFSLMNVSPMVQAVIVYMRDHCPKTPKDLNFHAELKAASQWCWSDDYKQLVMKKVPVGDCRLKIAAKETLQTWEKKERDLQTIKANKMGDDRDSSDESVDEQLSDVREAIGVLKKYIASGASRLSHVNGLLKRKVSEPELKIESVEPALKHRRQEDTFQTLGRRSKRILLNGMA